MNATTEEWIFKAEEDFDSADLLMHGREAPIADTACFHFAAVTTESIQWTAKGIG